MKIGGGMVYVRSFKLKLVTMSSTESEWVVLCEATMLAEWMQSMLVSFGIAIKPILIRQDNTSTIWLAEHGASFARTKHLLVKKNKAKEGIINGISTIEYTPTELMMADMGTKPLSHRQLLIHLKCAGLMIPVTDGMNYDVADIDVPMPRLTQRNEEKKVR
jgi:hypothetical protein